MVVSTHLSEREPEGGVVSVWHSIEQFAGTLREHLLAWKEPQHCRKRRSRESASQSRGSTGSILNLREIISYRTANKQQGGAADAKPQIQPQPEANMQTLEQY